MRRDNAGMSLRSNRNDKLSTCHSWLVQESPQSSSSLLLTYGYIFRIFKRHFILEGIQSVMPEHQEMNVSPTEKIYERAHSFSKRFMI